MRKTSTTTQMTLAIRRAVTQANMLVWAKEDIKEIMTLLGISNSNWAIGGSIAAMLYGIDPGRIPHDVDIIVPQGFIDVLKLKVEHSTLFRADPTTSSIDDEWGTKHFAFRTARGYIIDIIEDKNFFEESVISMGDVNVMTIDVLIKHKKGYHRAKDLHDLELLKLTAIQMGFNIEDESITDPDIEALAALKAKMEADVEETTEEGE